MSKRTLEGDMTGNIAAWPADWDLHIIKTINLYFDKQESPSVKMIQMNSTFLAFQKDNRFENAANLTYAELRNGVAIDSIVLRGSFDCEGRIYIVDFRLDTDQSVIGTVFSIIGFTEDSDGIDSTLYVVPVERGFFVALPIGLIRCRSAWEGVTKLESHILDDYWRNSGGGGGDDEDPELDPAPQDSVTPSLTN